MLVIVSTDSTNGDIKSAGVINDAIKDFSAVSGLHPNMNKSSLVFGSLNIIEKGQLMSVMKFKEGALPFRYLGVPLVTKRIGVKYCQNLIDRETEDWKCKSLSYARRLLLIASILESISAYWAFVFKLPKTMIKEINAKHIWNIASKKDTLWVKWVHSMRLKEDSIWNVQHETGDSWNWKCLLEIRDRIASRMQFAIGDGKGIHMWTDKWQSNGLLINQISHRDLYDARMSKKTSLADMINNGSWNWPNEWNSDEFEVMKTRTPKLKEGVPDKVMWIDNNTLVPFRTKNVMEFISPNVNDSHSHLFFLCDYSKEIWKVIADKIQFAKISYIWEDIINDLIKMCDGKNIWSVLRRLCLAAVVYFIWQERNQRIFRGCKRNTKELQSTITEVIKLKLMNLSVKNTNVVRIVADV
ncbi:hypothetical protein Tco_1250044 [Tanacetum coccineum]